MDKPFTNYRRGSARVWCAWKRTVWLSAAGRFIFVYTGTWKMC